MKTKPTSFFRSQSAAEIEEGRAALQRAIFGQLPQEDRAARAAGASADLKQAAAGTVVIGDEFLLEEASPWTEDRDGDPFLIEGHLYYRTVTVNLPHEAGVTFRLANAGMGAGVPVMLHIHPATSRFAHVFQQSPEGVHPFLGRAERVEKPTAPATKEGGAS